jgi:integrase
MRVSDVILQFMDETLAYRKPDTHNYYLRTFRRPLEELGEMDTGEVNQDTVNTYASKMRADGRGRVIQKELLALKAAYRSSGLYPTWSTPRQLYGLPKRSSPIPTDQEVGLIFSQTTGDFRLGISLVLLAGLRPQEAFRVGFNHVDCNNWTLLVPSCIRKAGHDNLLPVVDTLRVQIVNRSPMIKASESELSNELRRLSRWAGIREWRGLQTFRRVLVMWLEEEGYAGHAHMVTGHVRSDMAGHYTHGLGHLRIKLAILSSVEGRLLRAVEQVNGQHKDRQQHPTQEGHRVTRVV